MITVSCCCTAHLLQQPNLLISRRLQLAHEPLRPFSASNVPVPVSLDSCISFS